MSIGLLILRLLVGLTLAGHGAQKLFGWFGGYGVAGTGQFMEQLGFRPGWLYAAQAGLAELLGGLFLAAGFLTPAAAAAVAAVMLVAAVSAHLKKGFFAHNGGYEYTLVLGGAAVALAFTGPGALSLDQVLGISLSGESWGLAAVTAGLIGGTLPLLARRTAPVTSPQDAA
jgi:putative oxidoreductase